MDINKELMQGVWKTIQILDSEGWRLLQEYPSHETHISKDYQELITHVKGKLETVLKEAELNDC